MLTLYYVAATWLQSWRLSSTLTKIKEVRKKKGSIALHHEITPYVYMVPSASMQSKIEVNGVLSKSCSNHNMSTIKDLLWYTSNKKILSFYPQQLLDISSWITVIPGKTHLPIQFNGTKVRLSPERVLMLLEADYHTCQYYSNSVVLEIERFGVPLAWHVRENMSILFETDEKKLAALCVAFMQNNVTLENGVEIIRIISVEATGSPYRIQNSHTVPETYAPIDPDLGIEEKKESFMSRWRAHVSMLGTFSEAVEQVMEAQEEISVRHPGSGVGAVRLVPNMNSLITKEECVVDEAASIASEREEGLEEDEAGGSSVATPTHPTVPLEPSTPSSTRDDSISRISTDTVIPPDSTRVSGDFSLATSISSLKSLPSTPRRTTLSSPAMSSISSKPPNIVLFSDSSSASDSIKTALEATLMKDKYTYHKLPCSGLLSEGWSTEARLAVVHGDVPPPYTAPLIRYLSTVPQASVFCLCSDLLGVVLPLFRTAEVRPNELVRCSYKSWKHVPLVHHVFCYQPSPSAQQFSHDEHTSLDGVIPASVEMVDESGKKHKLKVEVLGVEETWRTPSLLLVTFPETNSKIIFSQVHLELDPSTYTCDEDRRLTLQQSDKARMEILNDVLSNHFGLVCILKQSTVKYSHAYFLGNHERKQELVKELTEKGHLDTNSVLQCEDHLSVKFCGKGITPPPPSAILLPILMHSCPETFSTVEYFENLKTESLGRLVIFTQIMTSSMNVVKGPPLQHGFTVIPLYQTQGKGRGSNTWLSPEGCAMFTIQLHIPLSSPMGQCLSFLQHIASLAVVTAICEISGLQELDIGLKWPNDIYANKTTKIGGVIANSVISANTAICNIGCGFNLSNKDPTICLNELIKSLNQITKHNVAPISHEKYFALVFNKLEELYEMAQTGHIDAVHRLYYNYWLHTDTEVKVKEGDVIKEVTIKGINQYGFLVADTPTGQQITIESDGNSFDMMQGLIIPKIN